MKTKMRYPKTMVFEVTQQDIDNGEACSGHKCMIHLAVQRELGGIKYVHVDARGLSVTRRTDYREHAVLPRYVLEKLYQHDKEKRAGLPCTVRPFSFRATFNKTTQVTPSTLESRAHKSATRKSRRGQPEKQKRYRLEGVAF